MKPAVVFRTCAAIIFIITAFDWDGFAAELRIIHTNDLHSHLEHSADLTRGGYAALRAKIDELRVEAARDGVDFLVLDAGDFTEGSQFFLADDGADAFRMLNEIGYDAVSIGNHDWLTGQAHLDSILAQVPPGFSFLAANFVAGSLRKNIRSTIQPYAEFTRAGAKIAILGLATNGIWSFRAKDQGVPFPLLNPVRTAERLIPKLRKNNDFVFALTHLGWKGDVELAQETSGLDLIVGGHSHTCLYEPIWARNSKKHWIPIVQSGNFAETVGDLRLEIVPGQPVELLSYRLVPVFREEGEDAEVLKRVDEVREHLNQKYRKEWLGEVVGFSSVPLEAASKKNTEWGRILAQTFKKTGNADLGLAIANFQGLRQPPGPITREQLFELYPRVFDFNSGYGWNVWTSRISGLTLYLALSGAIYKMKEYPAQAFSVAGADIKVTTLPGGTPVVKSFKVNGRRLKWNKYYTVAMDEGVVRGSAEISSALRLLLDKPRDTGRDVWREVAGYIQDDLGGTIGPQLSEKTSADGESYFGSPEPASDQWTSLTCNPAPSKKRFK